MKTKLKNFTKELDLKKDELHIQLENFRREVEENLTEKEVNLKKSFTDIFKTLEKNLVPMDSNIEDLKEYYSRMVSDVKELKLLNTDYSPSRGEIKKLGEDIDVVISCRGERNIKTLHPTHVNSMEDILKGSLEECRGKKVIFYIHGYNVNRKIALAEANNLFKKLKKDVEGYKFILFTWPGDSGFMKFSLAQNFAEYSGELLYKIVRRLKEEYSVEETTLIAHSLGSHVALRSASLMGGRERYKNVLLLGPAIEENILSKDDIKGRYWYPEALNKIENLNVVYSKTDITLEVCFSLYELGRPLGSNTSKYEFDPRVKIHDLTPMNCHIKEIAVHSHLQYWETDEQVEFYKKLLFNNNKTTA